MPTSIRNAKRSNSIRDTAAERWSRLYADVRASYGRASIQSALLLNGGASIALLAFLGNLAIAQQTKGLSRELQHSQRILRVLWSGGDVGRR